MLLLAHFSRRAPRRHAFRLRVAARPDGPASAVTRQRPFRLTRRLAPFNPPLVCPPPEIVGLEDGLGVECLSGSGAIASAYSRAFREGFTITLVSGRTVGIGAYLARLGRRCGVQSRLV